MCNFILLAESYVPYFLLQKQKRHIQNKVNFATCSARNTYFFCLDRNTKQRTQLGFYWENTILKSNSSSNKNAGIIPYIFFNQEDRGNVLEMEVVACAILYYYICFTHEPTICARTYQFCKGVSSLQPSSLNTDPQINVASANATRVPPN